MLLRQRAHDGALELRVNGVFVMDTLETTSERALGDLAAEAAADLGARHGACVLVGGLGLGFTLQAVLASAHVSAVIVAEIEPSVVAWNRAGLIPQTASWVDDPRVRIEVGDVAGIVEAQPAGSLDVILLDVDNGPGYLVYDANARLYEGGFLASCRSALAPQGRLLVWSSAESADFEARLIAAFDSVAHKSYPVRLGSRSETYTVYEARSA